MDDDLEWLEGVITQHENLQSTIRVLSVAEEILVGEGENYMSEVKRLVVRLLRGDSDIAVRSFVLKALPTSKNHRAFIVDSGFYFVEFLFYRDILSTAETILKQIGIPDSIVWPKFVSYTPYDKIVLEDLTAQGYEMADKATGIDLDHCTLVMQNLGFYHALTILLKERNLLPSVILNEHGMVRNRKDFEIWQDAGIKKLVQYMEHWGDDWQKTREKLRTTIDGYADKIFKLHTFKECEFVVLSHGDCWVNNLLFKYNVYTRKPIFMRFIDFQLSCFASPALDLVYFLTTSPNMDVRLHHRKSLVRTYYESLIFNMDRMGVVERRPTFEELQAEMKRMAFLTIHFMVTILPVLTLQKGKKLELENILEEFEARKAKGENMTEVFQGSIPEYTEYTISIFKMLLKEAEEEGVI